MMRLAALPLLFAAVLISTSTVVKGFISTPQTTSLKYNLGFPTRSLALPSKASPRRARGDAHVLLEPPMRYNSEVSHRPLGRTHVNGNRGAHHGLSRD